MNVVLVGFQRRNTYLGFVRRRYRLTLRIEKTSSADIRIWFMNRERRSKLQKRSSVCDRRLFVLRTRADEPNPTRRASSQAAAIVCAARQDSRFRLGNSQSAVPVKEIVVVPIYSRVIACY